MSALGLGIAVVAFFFMTVVGCAVGLAKLGPDEDIDVNELNKTGVK